MTKGHKYMKNDVARFSIYFIGTSMTTQHILSMTTHQIFKCAN